MITIEKDIQQGFAEYREKFGEYEFEGIPPCLALQMIPIWCVKELGLVLGKCAKENRKATAKEVVDALYLNKDGVYLFFETKEKSYEKFIEKTTNLSKRLLF